MHFAKVAFPTFDAPATDEPEVGSAAAATAAGVGSAGGGGGGGGATVVTPPAAAEAQGGVPCSTVAGPR
jgi:hypothetical protein